MSAAASSARARPSSRSETAGAGLLRGERGIRTAGPDIARAIAETLLHREGEAGLVVPFHRAVQAVAPPRGEFDAEEAHGRAVGQPGLGRIVGLGGRLDPQMERVGGLEEAGRAGPQGRPRGAAGIDRAEDHEGQQRIEQGVLLDQSVADHPGADLGHALGGPDARLEGDLAPMPGRRVHGGPPSVQAAVRPASVFGKGRKPGNSSIRESQARIAG